MPWRTNTNDPLSATEEAEMERAFLEARLTPEQLAAHDEAERIRAAARLDLLNRNLAESRQQLEANRGQQAEGWHIAYVAMLERDVRNAASRLEAMTPVARKEVA